MEFRVPSDLHFLDSMHGSLVVHLGAGMSHDYFAIFTSADGGQTWQRVLDPNSDAPVMACYKSGLAFTSPEIGWLSGDCPGLMPSLFFFNTADGGTNWSAVNLPAPTGKPANYFNQESVGCGISSFDYTASNTLALSVRCRNLDNDTRQAWLYITRDSGASWSQQPLPLFFGRLWVDNPNEAVFVGSLSQDAGTGGALFHTLNGGQEWNQLTSTGWTGAPDFIDMQNGWVVAENGATKALVHTINGGITWEEIKPVIGPR